MTSTSLRYLIIKLTLLQIVNLRDENVLHSRNSESWCYVSFQTTTHIILPQHDKLWYSHDVIAGNIHTRCVCIECMGVILLLFVPNHSMYIKNYKSYRLNCPTYSYLTNTALQIGLIFGAWQKPLKWINISNLTIQHFQFPFRNPSFYPLPHPP